VQRATPKILASLTRAVNLTESTLAFGRAEEPSPKLERVRLADIAEDVVENERLTWPTRRRGRCITYVLRRAARLVLRADPEQLHRVLSNLVRNARQAILATGKAGEIRIDRSERDGGWRIEVSDTGPGLPKKALDHLFKPFHGGARKGGQRSGPRHRGGDHARPWRYAGTCANRSRGDDLRHLPSLAGLPSERVAPRIPLAPLAAGAKPRPHAPVAQLDRVLDYESRGRGFESSPVRHFLHLRYRPSGCLSESLLRYRPSGRLSVG
jgi:hypothetical protein